MADFAPLIPTDSDVKEPALLLRYLRKSADRVLILGDRIGKVEKAPKGPTYGEIRDQLEATGSTPLNVTGLLGVLAQPQPASATIFSTAPTGQVLQTLRDQQLVLVGTTSTGYALDVVIGGNPSQLFTLVSGLSSGNFMTLDTVQTATALKTFTASAIMGDGTAAAFLRVDGAAGQVRDLRLQTNASNRWILRGNGTVEAGANAGSDLDLISFTDGGAVLDTPVSVKRATGNLTFSKVVASYNGIATAGLGVPPILYATSTNSAVSVGGGGTALSYTTTAAGTYQLSGYSLITTAATSTGLLLNLLLIWTDQAGAYTNTVTVLATTTGPLFHRAYIHADSGTNLTVQVGLTGTGTSTSARVNLYSAVEKIST